MSVRGGPVLGVDVAAVDRIARALQRHPSLVQRCFTEGEARTSGTRPERWAGRWAVKEAVRKVYGGRGWPIPAYRAIEVRRPPGRAPTVLVRGAVVPGLAVSLTHDAGVAIAVAMHQEPGGTTPGPRRPDRVGWDAPGLLDAARALRVPVRSPDAHKGTFGTVLVVAGHAAFPGAAVLCALGALRGGAGRVRAVVPVGAGGAAAFPPEVILRTVAAGAEGGLGPEALAVVAANLDQVQAVAVGPGLGRAEETRRFLHGLLDRVAARSVPLVLDADALNACAEDPTLLARVPPGTILTPHPAEMARLCGVPVARVQADRSGVATQLARRLGAVVVLKGAGTVVAAPDGVPTVDPHATAALAIGGSGDVLTGLIGALRAQGLTAADAARTGVFVHGEAGRRLAEARGRAGLLATEIASAMVESQEQLRRAVEDDRPG